MSQSPISQLEYCNMIPSWIQFSGIASILVAWLLVVAPVFIHGIDAKKQSITDITCLNATLSKIVTFGLILGAGLQGLFLWHLITVFQFSLFSVGGILFLSSNIATIFVSVFHYSKHPKIHDFFARYYFILNPISLIYISYYAKPTNPFLFPVTLSLILANLIGTFLIALKFRKSAYVELLAFLIMSIWTAIFTLT